MDTKENTITKPKMADQQKQAEQDMLYRLKSAIDSKGRYAYRLNDLASGYAAGNGMPATTARMEIERKFTEQFGKSPQEYLDRHYEEMRENGRSPRGYGEEVERPQGATQGRGH